jgi:hypothetical protein
VIPGPGGAARPHQQPYPYHQNSGHSRFHELLQPIIGFWWFRRGWSVKG